MRITDAHVHLWDTASHALSWFRPEMGLPAQVSASDLRAAVSVDAAIAVQAADTLAEARWLLAQASAHPLPSRVVLQYAPTGDDAVGAVAPAMQDAVAGLRAAIPQFAADLHDVPGLEALGRELATTGRVLEFLVRPEQLPGVAAFADRHPDLTVVICHLGLGSQEASETWRTGFASAGRRANVNAKLSGIVGSRTADELAGMTRTAIDVFGPRRLMFGSDWPMSARTHTHAEVVAATGRSLAGLSAQEAAEIWHATADRIYGVGAS